MKTTFSAEETAQGVNPAHTIEIVCAHCGYDLDELEVKADTCSDCGETLNLKQHVAIQVTTFPAVFGETM